jgi:hypothetical protein
MLLQLKEAVSAVFDLPFLKPLEAQLKPVRAFCEAKPVLVLGGLVALLLLPISLLLTRRISSQQVSSCS